MTVRNVSLAGKVLVLLLVALLIPGAPAGAAGPFSDVPAGHWAYSALEQLSEAGLVDGYPSGFFSTSRRLTRYEVALSVVRALERLSERSFRRTPSAQQLDVADLWIEYNEANPDEPLSPAVREVLGSVVTEFEPELVMLGYGRFIAALDQDRQAAVLRVEAADAASRIERGGAQVAAWERRAGEEAVSPFSLSEYVLPGTPLSGGTGLPADSLLLRSLSETLTGFASVVPVTPYLSLRGERTLRTNWEGEAGATAVAASVRLGDVSLDGRMRTVEPGFGTSFTGADAGGEAVGVGLTVPLGDLRLTTGRDRVLRASEPVEHVMSWALEYGEGDSAQVRAQWESVSLADLRQARSRASVDVNVPVAQGAVHLGLAHEAAPDPASGVSVTTVTVAGFDFRLLENAEARAAIALQDSGTGQQRTTSLGLRYTLSPEAALRLGYKLIDFTDKDSQNVATAEFTIRF
mgnify:FL=1